VPQVRVPVLGANLGDALPQSRVGASSVHVEGSAALSGIRTVAFRHLQLLPAAAIFLDGRDVRPICSVPGRHALPFGNVHLRIRGDARACSSASEWAATNQAGWRYPLPEAVFRQTSAKPTIPREVRRILAKEILRSKREKLSGSLWWSRVTFIEIQWNVG